MNRLAYRPRLAYWKVYCGGAYLGTVTSPDEQNARLAALSRFGCTAEEYANFTDYQKDRAIAPDDTFEVVRV